MKGYDQFQNPFTEMGSSGRTTPEIQSPAGFRLLTSSSESPCNSSGDYFPSSDYKDKQSNSVVAFRTKNKKLEKKANSYVYRIREHVKLGPKFSETLKGKLSLGAKIIQKGGRENIFRNLFSVSEGEQLLKASQCYLSTTAGPIAGLLFISTEKVAFCSDRKITLSSSTGEAVTTSYKVSIPVRKIERARESENAENPAQKYIVIVTEDKFEFWFMGFVRYEKAFGNLQKAISMSKSIPFHSNNNV